MFNKEAEKRIMAKSITHYVYRNTLIEDYHSQRIKMDMKLYKKIYKVVCIKLKEVKKFHPYIYNSPQKFPDLKDMRNCLIVINSVSEEAKLKAIKYCEAIWLNMFYGTSWEVAAKLDINSNMKYEAAYILEGHFIECCKNGEILDNKTMCYINKDIHNRVYTLLVNGFFDSFLVKENLE